MLNNGNGFTHVPIGANLNGYESQISLAYPVGYYGGYPTWGSPAYSFGPNHLTNSSTGGNAYLPPAILSGNNGCKTGAELVDVNGDGLVDVISRGSFVFAQKGGWTNVNGV